MRAPLICLSVLLLFVGGALAADPAPCPEGKRCFDLAIRDGKLQGDSKTVRVKQGDRLELRWTTDAAMDLHLHGYNVGTKVEPGAVAVMALEAFATGRFSVETHGAGGAHARIMYLEVHPR